MDNGITQDGEAAVSNVDAAANDASTGSGGGFFENLFSTGSAATGQVLSSASTQLQAQANQGVFDAITNFFKPSGTTNTTVQTASMSSTMKYLIIGAIVGIGLFFAGVFKKRKR